jgi:hypothetical protein
LAAGGPNDHPLSDVITYGLEVYGKEADLLLFKLSKLLSQRELNEFWDAEIGFLCDNNKAYFAIKHKYNWAVKRSVDSGWE